MEEEKQNKTKKKENATELQKPNIKAEVCNNNEVWQNIHIYI